MSDEQVGIGVVGCGWAGRQAALAASLVPRTRLAAVADLDAARRRDVAAEFSVESVFETHEELLAHDGVDAAYLATPPVGRFPLVMDALAARKHVLVQKPHAIEAAEIREMEAKAAAVDRTLMFCYFNRHDPANRRLRAAVRDGLVGDVYHARVFVRFNHIPPFDDGTRWQHVYGQKGGALGQHASHELDLAWWLMGCPEPCWGSATKHTPYPQQDEAEPAEDYLSGLVGLAGGATIQVDCSRMLHSEAANVFEVYGTDGAVSGRSVTRYDREEGTFREVTVDAEAAVDHTDPPDRPADDPCYFYHEVEHFALAVADEVRPDVDADDAHRFMTMLDALYESARENEKVVID